MHKRRKLSFGPAQLIGALANSMKGKRKYVSRSRSVSRGRSSTRRSSSRRTPANPKRPRTGATTWAKSRSRSRSAIRYNKNEESGQHNDLGESYISVKNGVIPRRYKGLVKGALQHQYGNKYNQTSSGGQWFYNIASLITRSQITGTTAINGTTTQDSWPCNPFDLNPYQGTTAGGLLTAVGQPANDRCFIHTIKGEIDLTGLENITQEVTLYLVKYKITTNNDMPALWQNILDAGSTGLNQPAAVQATTAAAPTYGRPFHSTYGQTFSSHPTMRKMFKVLAAKKCVLTPGSTHKFKYNIKYNRLIDKDYFNESAGSNEYVKGMTLQWVMMMRPAPILESTTGKMTPGPVNIGFMNTYTVKVSFPMEKRLYAYRTDAGFIAGTTLANDKLINDVDAAATVFQQ